MVRAHLQTPPLTTWGDPSEQMTLMYLGHLKELRNGSMCTDHFTIFSAHLLFSCSLSSLICFAPRHKTSQEVNQMFPEQFRNAGGSRVVFCVLGFFPCLLPSCLYFLSYLVLFPFWSFPSTVIGCPRPD